MTIVLADFLARGPEVTGTLVSVPLAVRILIGVLVFAVLALALCRPSRKDTPPGSGDDQ